jgi:hypothetical protein
VISSPKLPVRLSTLILSWRNFSNAAGSKILSFVGADASRMNYVNLRRKRVPFGIAFLRRVCQISRESAYCLKYNSKATGLEDILFLELGPWRRGSGVDDVD